MVENPNGGTPAEATPAVATALKTSAIPSIILVDDNPGDIELIKLAFQEQGIAVEFLVANSGPGAFMLLQQWVEDPTAVLPCMLLLDLQLPGVNGLHLLAYIRSQPALSHLKILILSSTARPQDHAQALALGASGCLVKPSDWEGYAGLINQLRPLIGQ